MKNILSILIVAVAAWLFLTKCVKPGPPKEATQYVNAMKQDEDRAAAAGTTANVAVVQEAVNNYRAATNSYPASLKELVDKNYIGHIPGGIKYDPESGQVTPQSN